jgi:hypothetical protein
MGKLAISIDGKAVGTWEGEEAAVKKILDNLPRAAAGLA